MEAIVVHHLGIVNPHFAAIVRVRPESIVSCFLDHQGTCPTYCKIIALIEARPIATSIAVVRLGDLPHHRWLALAYIWQPVHLVHPVEHFFFEVSPTTRGCCPAT